MALFLLLAIFLQAPGVGDAIALLQRGDFAAAEQKLRTFTAAHPDDANALSLLGAALDNQKKSAEADAFHRRAVALAPKSVEALNNFAVHLWMTGKQDEAKDVYLRIVGIDPANASANQLLAQMAMSYEGNRQPERALEILAVLAKANPTRAEIQKTIAVIAAEVGAIEDSVAAWDRYLALQPNDDVARRERAYDLAKMGKVDEALATIKPLVARHPEDVLGHYELGQVGHDPAEFDAALKLDPKYVPALNARGSLYYQAGKAELAVRDFEAAVAFEPDGAGNYDRLGQAYQALDKTADAVRVLRKAAELAPGDPKILLHYGRALADAGDADGSKAVMDRYRQLPPEKKSGVPAGFVDFLTLSPEERRASYRARTEKAVREHPDDASIEVAWLKLLLEENQPVSEVVDKIVALRPPAALLTDAAQALTAAGLQSEARTVLAVSPVLKH